MNFAIKLTLILIILGIITSLSGSELFWWVIILLPIVILIRTRKKIELSYIVILFFLFFFFWISLMIEWVLSIGDLIVLIYLCLILYLGWILFWLKEYKWADISPFPTIGFILAVVWTIIISSNMPTPLPIAPSTTVPVANTWSKSTTWTISTWTQYPL